jgi:hypothetical protein
MTYSKPWLTCLDKLDQFNKIPVKKWNKYQLLGYLFSKTGQTLQKIDDSNIPVGYEIRSSNEPRRHPAILALGRIFVKCSKDATKAKVFLDFCIKKYGDKLYVGGLDELYSKYICQSITTAPRRIDRGEPLPPDIIQVLAPHPKASLLTTYGALAFSKKDPEVQRLLSTISFNFNQLDLVI